VGGNALPPPGELVGRADPGKGAFGGGSTVIPTLTERRPMTYVVFETEMKSISALNGGALRWFSIGAFMLMACLNILVANAFGYPIPEVGEMVIRWCIWVTGGASVLCYIFGGISILSRHSVIEQIKNETRKKEGGALIS
jgi:hypothetical protein